VPSINQKLKDKMTNKKITKSENSGKEIDGKSWVYSKTVEDHFFKPRNVMTDDIDENKYDAVGEVGSPACGDLMKVWIRVENDIIEDLKWKTFGCASAIASTSILSEMAQGMSLGEANKITAQDIVEKLGGLPRRKIHCSVLGDQALRKAIENYRQK